MHQMLKFMYLEDIRWWEGPAPPYVFLMLMCPLFNPPLNK